MRTGPPRTLRLPGVSEPHVVSGLVAGVVAGEVETDGGTVRLLDPARRRAGQAARSG